MRTSGKIGILVGMACVLVWGMAHAYMGRYAQKRLELLAGCKEASNSLTAEELRKLAARCATPEISLVTPSAVKPGDTADVSVTGTFPGNIHFLFESDAIEILKESCITNSYRATIKVSPTAGPEHLAITALVPGCCRTTRRTHAIAIAGNFTWDLKAVNGWTLKARSLAPRGASDSSKEFAYAIEFFRVGEPAPFEKRRANLFPSPSPPANEPTYHFTISNQDEESMNVQQEIEALGKKLQDATLSDDEREQLLNQLSEAVDKMSREVTKDNGEAYANRLRSREQEFGCTAITLTLDNGVAKGHMTCSDKVGRSVALTGTLNSPAR